MPISGATDSRKAPGTRKRSILMIHHTHIHIHTTRIYVNMSVYIDIIKSFGIIYTKYTWMLPLYSERFECTNNSVPKRNRQQSAYSNVSHFEIKFWLPLALYICCKYYDVFILHVDRCLAMERSMCGSCSIALFAANYKICTMNDVPYTNTTHKVLLYNSIAAIYSK